MSRFRGDLNSRHALPSHAWSPTSNRLHIAPGQLKQSPRQASLSNATQSQPQQTSHFAPADSKQPSVQSPSQSSAQLAHLSEQQAHGQADASYGLQTLTTTCRGAHESVTEDKDRCYVNIPRRTACERQQLSSQGRRRGSIQVRLQLPCCYCQLMLCSAKGLSFFCTSSMVIKYIACLFSSSFVTAWLLLTCTVCVH